MKLVNFETRDRYRAVGMLEGDRILDFGRALAMYLTAEGVSPQSASFSIMDLISAGWWDVDLLQDVRSFVARHELAERLSVEDARLLAPLARPPRIMALGRNYAAHATETGHKPPKEPIFFLKASTSVTGPGEPVVIPRGIGRVDHEVELAVVIGKGGRHISRRKAARHIAGYTILNDITARDMQNRDMAQSHPWFMSKSIDSFAPMGPCITLPDEITEPCELDLSLRVNGKVRQKGNTRDLIFKVPDITCRLSRYLTLAPGDVISTGTPDGISPVEPGDVMEAEIERIGVLRNPVVAGK